MKDSISGTQFEIRNYFVNSQRVTPIQTLRNRTRIIGEATKISVGTGGHRYYIMDFLKYNYFQKIDIELG